MSNTATLENAPWIRIYDLSLSLSLPVKYGRKTPNEVYLHSLVCQTYQYVLVVVVILYKTLLQHLTSIVFTDSARGWASTEHFTLAPRPMRLRHQRIRALMTEIRSGNMASYAYLECSKSEKLQSPEADITNHSLLYSSKPANPQKKQPTAGKEKKKKGEKQRFLLFLTASFARLTI